MNTREQTYVLAVAGLLIILALCVAAFNFVVDPYDMYRGFRLPQALHKAGYHGQDRMVKAQAVRRLQPDVLLLGTSRTQFGMNPDSPVLASFAKRPYNLGLLGSGPYLALRYLQHAQANSPVSVAVVGLDPLMFDVNNRETDQGFEESRLDADSHGKKVPWAFTYDVATTLLSWDALHTSMTTLRHQRTLDDEMLHNGTRNPEVLEEQLIEHGGTHGNFRAAEQDYLQSFRDYHLYDAEGYSAKLADLRSLVAYARRQGIALHFYISPSHARMNEVIRVAGKTSEVETWKRAVVQILDDDGRAHSREQAFTLWDFSGASSYTSEAVPPPKAGKPMHWFWESSHFKQSLGEQVLRRIFAQPDAPHNFGALLTPKTVNPVLRRLRVAQERYGNRHPADVLEVNREARDIIGATVAATCASQSCGR